MGKIGFCCNYVSPDGNDAAEKLMRTSTTTVTALSKLSVQDRIKKVVGITANNLANLNRLVEHVAKLPEGQRILRIGSDLLPCFTHEIMREVYQDPTINSIMQQDFKIVGETARKHDIRLGFHPSQFCVLNNPNPAIRDKAIMEFEYHTMMFEHMGYDSGWHPHGASVNIHAGGKANGLKEFVRGLKKLSKHARNLITIENDEFSFGLDDMQFIAEHTAITLDIHHHWIHTGGDFIQNDDPRLEYVIESWKGVRPLAHFSTSPEEIIKHQATDVLPDYRALVASGYNRKDLRRHSDMCWNTAANEWALSHLTWADIEVEAKNKNLASTQLFNQATKPA